MQVFVRDNDVNSALRVLKKKDAARGHISRDEVTPVLREVRRAREKAESIRRYRKLLRKRLEREGY